MAQNKAQMALGDPKTQLSHVYALYKPIEKQVTF